MHIFESVASVFSKNGNHLPLVSTYVETIFLKQIENSRSLSHRTVNVETYGDKTNNSAGFGTKPNTHAKKKRKRVKQTRDHSSGIPKK